MSQSLTPIVCSVFFKSARNATACSGERMSGSVTISTSGVPQRLKSTSEKSAPAIRPARPAGVHQLGRVLLQVGAGDADPAAVHDQLARPADRLVVLGDLVGLGAVGIEVVLAVKTADAGAISQSSASPIWIALSTAAWLITGSTPGWPRHSGQVSVLGSAPKRFSHAQNILVAVFSWTWISRPITGSQSAAAHAFPARSAGGMTAHMAIETTASMTNDQALWMVSRPP